MIKQFDLDIAVKPNLCSIFIGNEKNYGFDFLTHKKSGVHIVENVIPGKPAFKAGLHSGQYVLEVNGQSISGIDHKNAVKIIRSSQNRIDLLVVSDLKSHSREGIQPQLNDGLVSDYSLRGKISYHRLSKMPNFNGLGFSMNNKNVIEDVVENSPAEIAYLKKDDKIVEINGIDINNKSMKEITKLIRKHETNLILGVNRKIIAF